MQKRLLVVEDDGINANRATYAFDADLRDA